jgi:hypothetical protein
LVWSDSSDSSDSHNKRTKDPEAIRQDVDSERDIDWLRNKKMDRTIGEELSKRGRSFNLQFSLPSTNICYVLLIVKIFLTQKGTFDSCHPCAVPLGAVQPMVMVHG